MEFDDDSSAPPVDGPFCELRRTAVPEDLSAPGPHHLGERHLNILVVDDHPAHRHRAQTIFEALGCAVDLAESGAEALGACAGADFDLVLMDRNMPGGHGDHAVQRLRRREGSARRTFIACHSSDPPRDLSAGYDVVAPKPLTVATAADLLRQAADRATCASLHSGPES
jgi:CheY-like chemotaxis protein